MADELERDTLQSAILELLATEELPIPAEAVLRSLCAEGVLNLHYPKDLTRVEEALRAIPSLILSTKQPLIVESYSFVSLILRS